MELVPINESTVLQTEANYAQWSQNVWPSECQFSHDFNGEQHVCKDINLTSDLIILSHISTASLVVYTVPKDTLE